MRHALWLCFLIGGALAAEPVLQPISYGCSGGFTSGGRTRTLAPDGSVKACERSKATAAPVCTTQPGDAARYRQVNALLDAAKFDSLPAGEPMNMTCTFTRGDKSVVVTAHGPLTAAVEAFPR
jgi:hypothetical protein